MHARTSAPFSLMALVITIGLTIRSARAQDMTAELVTTVGYSSVTFATAPPNDVHRLFVTAQYEGPTTPVRIVDLNTNTFLQTPFLTVSPAFGGEEGLLGMAFDPNYATNGYFYVDYVAPGGGPAGHTIVERYTVSATNPDVADPSTAYTILVEPQPFNNHKAGWIGFGPDGYLYVSLGDGGSEGDPHGFAQNLGSRLGKMLRIDVSADAYPSDPDRNYTVPPTNPFINTPGALPEIWHYGLRNAWRPSFDRLTGDMWIADVGGGLQEEIDFVPAGVGGLNFGWRCMEGNLCTGLTGCTCNSSSLTLPVQTYDHSGGNCAIIGGYRYRGQDICGLSGTYFYADYCSHRIWTFEWNGSSVTHVVDRTAQLTPPGVIVQNIFSFAEDARGELYFMDAAFQLFKIVPSLVDCNHNGIDDTCDILSGASADANQDGIPDECQSTPYCFGDGTGTGCPCANAGVAGNGCANSHFPRGAHLQSVGVSRLSFDTLTLQGSAMPDTPLLYFQGTTQVNGGLGAVFGDGLRCAGGAAVRLGVKINSSNGSMYPASGDLPISIKGAIPPTGGTRTYQAWYRDSAGPCNSGFNLTNGLQVTWVP